MSNKYRWHLYILPEDDATRQLGNGLARARSELFPQIYVEKERRGWKRAVEGLKDLCLDKYTERRVLIIVDFDEDEKRLELIKNDPLVQKFSDRVFIVGSSVEAEDIRRAFLGGLESIGTKLAMECSCWDNEILKHCKEEICRLKRDIDANFC